MSEGRRMAPVDITWLRMDLPKNRMTIVGVIVLREPVDLDRVERTLAARLLSYDRFRQKVENGTSAPRWRDDEHFDIGRHIRRARLPGAAGKEQLQRLVAELATRPLDTAHPLWEIHVVEQYEEGVHPAGSYASVIFGPHTGFAGIPRHFNFQVDFLWQLLGGTVWLPGEGKFGFLPFILGNTWVTVVAMVLAGLPCVLTAIYLAEFAIPSAGAVKPLLDLLAGIPPVVYGLWGVIAIVPFVQTIGPTHRKVLGFIPFFAVRIILRVIASWRGEWCWRSWCPPLLLPSRMRCFVRTGWIPRGFPGSGSPAGVRINVQCCLKPFRGSWLELCWVVHGRLGETMAVLMVVEEGNVVKIPTSIFDPAYPLPALIANNYGENALVPAG